MKDCGNDKKPAKVSRTLLSTSPRHHIDKAEAKRFLQIKTVVHESDAFRYCTYAARCVYMELSARLKWVSGQRDPANNGHLWLSREQWAAARFSSATVTRSIRQLIKHGLIFRTRSGGIGRGCSMYALTCLPLSKDRDGIFCKGFVKDAWADYVPKESIAKKNRESNVNRTRVNADLLPPESDDKVIISKPDPSITFNHQESESTNLGDCEAPAGSIRSCSSGDRTVVSASRKHATVARTGSRPRRNRPQEQLMLTLDEHPMD